MFEPPLINQLLGTGAVILGFIGAVILVRQMELHELEKQRKLKNVIRRLSKRLTKRLKSVVILNVRKSVKTSAESFKDLRLITNALKV